MSRRTILFIAAIGVAAVAGCYTGPNADLSPAVHGPGSSTDGTDPQAGSEGTPSSTTPAAATGLPCDVAKVLAESCTDCHGRELTGGAPNPLVTFDDLKAPSKTDPSRTVAEVSLDRMREAKRPMPPDGKVEPADIAILEKWIGAGMPRGTCGEKSTAADGGSDAGANGDAAMKPADASVDAASVCTSGTTWAKGTPASPLMHPGKQCIACHSATGGPSFVLAGTVYPTMHEPNDCNGIGSSTMSVLIIDATGKSHTMPVNAAGNFTRVTSIPMPYRAMVVNGAKVREMKTPQTDGDCNGCHSETGTHSPGRIMAP